MRRILTVLTAGGALMWRAGAMADRLSPDAAAALAWSYPDPAEAREIAVRHTRRLWERRRADADFLALPAARAPQ
jgi:DNA segregation ATPase FtsK/SpoIIIE-like protein